MSNMNRDNGFEPLEYTAEVQLGYDTGGPVAECVWYAGNVDARGLGECARAIKIPDAVYPRLHGGNEYLGAYYSENTHGLWNCVERDGEITICGPAVDLEFYSVDNDDRLDQESAWQIACKITDALNQVLG